MVWDMMEYGEDRFKIEIQADLDMDRKMGDIQKHGN